MQVTPMLFPPLKEFYNDKAGNFGYFDEEEEESNEEKKKRKTKNLRKRKKKINRWMKISSKTKICNNSNFNNSLNLFRVNKSLIRIFSTRVNLTNSRLLNPNR